MAAFRPSRLAADILRQQTCIRHTLPRRCFTSTTRNREPIGDFILAGPTAFINLIHTTGIPYYAAIPLTAVIVRSTIVYYLAVRPGRRQARLLHNLRPVIDAKSVLIRHTEGRKFRHQNREVLVSDSSKQMLDLMQLQWQFQYWRMRFSVSRHALKQFGYRWRPWGLVNFGVLIAFTESIRLKCGRSEGLLSLLLAPVEKASRGEMPWEGEKAPAIDPAQTLANKLQAMHDARLTGMDETEVSDASVNAIVQDPGYTQGLTSMPATTTTGPYFDPAMQVEGFDFCVDLTQADPTGLLPGAAALTLIATVLVRPKPATQASDKSSHSAAAKNEPGHEPQTQTGVISKIRSWQLRRTNLERIGLAFAAIFGIMLHSFPAGIVLYLGPHFLVGWLQRLWLERTDRMPKPITACKRQLWLDSRREW